MIIPLIAVLATPVHAQTADEDTSLLSPFVAPFMGTSSASQDEDTEDNAVKEKDKDKKDKEDKKDEPTASSTPATPVATTTPEAQRTNQSQKDQPRNDPGYNRTLENLLNLFVEPEKPIKENAKKQPALNQKATTTPKAPAPKPSATTTSTDNDDDTATTTPAGTFERTTDGGSNQFSPTNYYIPLDKLSPEITYSLSGVAMLFGIIGAVLILREPRMKEEQVWVPNFSEQSL
jgi:hypothetical protein